MNKSTNTKKARGFTIVELLVVIVVIGILTAISIVSYSGVTTKARNSAAAAQADAVKTAAETYYATNGTGYPFQRSDFTSGGSASEGVSSKFTANAFTNTAYSATSANYDKVLYTPCSSTVATPPTDASSTTGAKIGYYNYTGGAITTSYMYVGATSSSTPAAQCASVMTP